MIIASYQNKPLQLIYLDEVLLAQHVQSAPSLSPPKPAFANGPNVPTAATASPTAPAVTDSTATRNAKAKPPTNAAVKTNVGYDFS